MKKRISVIIFLTAIILSFGLFNSNVITFADSPTITVDSECAYLLDKNTKTVMFSKNENKRMPIASMCKIMTLNVIFECIDNGTISYDQPITVSANASGMGGSQIFLEENGEYKIDELIKGIVVASANDACVALAETICGSEENFVVLMNKKCEEYKMENTVFTNCTGLPKEGQYSTAKDVAIMFDKLLDHKDYFNYSKIWMDTANHPNNRTVDISNTNKLIKMYKYCDGGKTGYTSQAGHCLASTSIKNGLRLISVVIKGKDSKSRFNDAIRCFNYGFDNYSLKTVVDNSKTLNYSVQVNNAKYDTVSVKPISPFEILLSKGQKRNVEIVFHQNGKLNAPLKATDIVGELVIYENGVEIGKVDLVCETDVEKASYLDNLCKIFKNWIII